MSDRFVIRVAAMVVGSLLTIGCDTNDPGAPMTLMNGSRAPELPVDLEGVASPAVSTSVATSSIGEIGAGSAFGACAKRAQGERRSVPVVVRVGVTGESVTFRTESRRGLYGCDNSQGSREEGRRACGVAFGQLSEGRLEDPRLNVGACTTKGGEPLGFAWVQPVPNATFVAVEQDGYVEVYRTAGGLPIRVTTDDVEIDRSGATFRITEHAEDGGLIQQYRVEASVAG
ncbi:MAG: hypothetical protein OEW52_00605 [Thermoleophilia bacterium]|nr:hypothetical protein [Thermoleophilia bacterium]MDH4339004.1 hypothetical protein [Thermoleophilia bacterium]MDH5279629.1 hypothetical protein [Thermoleophilia bacterium]